MFISFEGIDGVGKTTQLGLLAQWLKEHAIPYLATREPGDHAIGPEMLSALQRAELSPMARAFLYLADRAQHFAEIVQPALERGLLVLCDRYVDSSIVYQSKVMSMNYLTHLNQLATNLHVPDLTFLLDMEPERIQYRNGVSQAHEAEQETSFYQRTREHYLFLAGINARRIKIINADQDEQVVQETIRNILRKRIGLH